MLSKSTEVGGPAGTRGRGLWCTSLQSFPKTVAIRPGGIARLEADSQRRLTGVLGFAGESGRSSASRVPENNVAYLKDGRLLRVSSRVVRNAQNWVTWFETLIHYWFY